MPLAPHAARRPTGRAAHLLATCSLLLASAGCPGLAPAQSLTTTRDSIAASRPTRVAAPAPEPLFTRHDAWIAAGFAAATVVAFPLDRRIAGRLENQDAQEERFLHHAATAAELLAIPGVYVLGAGFYVLGRATHASWMADAAVHGGEAVLVGTVAAEALKGLAGRARPYVVADTNPRDFSLGRGLSKGEGFAAFPSVHTLTAFAAASAVTAETARRWPRAAWYVGPVLYGSAALVGFSRMYHDQHWASDVAVRAAIGTFSGLKVERWNHQHPGNRIDRVLLDGRVAPAPGGGARIGWWLSTR